MFSKAKKLSYHIEHLFLYITLVILSFNNMIKEKFLSPIKTRPKIR